jgi:hypothetical protein
MAIPISTKLFPVPADFHVPAVVHLAPFVTYSRYSRDTVRSLFKRWESPF